MTAAATIVVSGVTVNQPGCVAHTPGQPAGTISVAAESTTVRNAAGVAGVRVTPAGMGTTFLELTLAGCTNVGLNNTYPVSGTGFGVMNNTTSTVEVNTPSGELRLGVNSATMKGTLGLDSEGKSVEVKE